MKPKASVFFLLLFITGCRILSADQLWQRVQKNGTVRVSVVLKVPAKAEANLTQDEVAAQRRAIRDAQNRLLKELDGIKYQLVGMLTTIPGMYLNVGADALAVLEKSALVSVVTGGSADRLLGRTQRNENDRTRQSSKAESYNTQLTNCCSGTC